LEITDLVREAHHWARAEGAACAQAHHVQKAISEKVYRNSYHEEIIGRMIEEGTLLVDTQGTAVGQANGLTVYDWGLRLREAVARDRKGFPGQGGRHQHRAEAELGAASTTKAS